MTRVCSCLFSSIYVSVFDVNSTEPSGWITRLVKSTSTNGEIGVVSENLDFYVPSLNYTTLLGTQNIWINFTYIGTNSNDKHTWELKDFGVNE